MMVTKVGVKVGALALALSLGAGCSFTTMETARQLESGEAVVGGGLDWPGILYIPRVSAYGKVGVGEKADLGLQGSFAFATANLGATARIYPTNWLTMSLQSDAIFVVNDLSGSSGPLDNTRTLLVFTPRISTAVNGDDFLYGGIQSNVLTGWEHTENGSDTAYTFQGATIGGFAGIETEISPGLNLQTELILMPVTVGDDGVNVIFSEGGGLPALFQWSVGLNYRFGGEPEAVMYLEPSEEPPVQTGAPANPQSEPASKTLPEPEPAPEYDKGGVPIY
ncbi:hypothetical protein DV096_13315 [Bradymonadaceae bacterium TMQ3]|uniref:Outer membrane protein beta-barrel domain-containing protein n=1 Tax=Lujinxingia sediminis TaxID=2480984 RepID=A0ABY0CU35_9DELT|nr:hypothetical protein [Lujinxingia sediminis]RDV37487.1 hypothetical protein DV096_13315 [Bradymonadaceae bacterium TMQ3]RVU45823.1 hypothetical protein EA187_08675 [Lujinxingia sediminis]TXC75045.1 hypothetical protein FRC91_13195 [Bradymonadales bacterium TMQ1]